MPPQQARGCTRSLTGACGARIAHEARENHDEGDDENHHESMMGGGANAPRGGVGAIQTSVEIVEVLKANGVAMEKGINMGGTTLGAYLGCSPGSVFFEIVHVTDTTAVTLKKEISDVLARYNLNIENMRGQGASPKRQNELQCAQVAEVEHMLDTGERETSRGANQIGTLHRAGTTRWSSHFSSICSLIDMYGATIKVLQTMVEEGSSNSIHGEAGGALIAVRSFDFIFILHLMHRIMGITDLLCRASQHKSLDILNTMDLVSTTKALLQTLRQDGFNTLLMHVGSVCTQYDIEMPMMDARYKEVTGRSC
ncbi:hypothetical protein Acr_23g0015540 [Actinidia rufa]|uniref:Uncharacterized protein n=1 Tax=Actinidia rufa TaxID=165716 RepID=A0A7J0GQV1_9ERIC|nr:hypothetical protein Acr_23g0015540 [Actinidia rufa]